MRGRWIRALAAFGTASVLTACGGGGGSSTSSDPASAAAAAAAGGAAQPAAYSGPPSDPPATKGAAARFLTQSSFGPTSAEIDRMMTLGYTRWVDEQLAKPAGTPHLDYFAARTAELDEDDRISEDWIYQTFWRNAVSGEDQLRQRVAFALSQIFVISMADPGSPSSPAASPATWTCSARTRSATSVSCWRTCRCIR
ncbi:MAG: DUF1800 family protein [Burkholderiaceae bacterium]